MSDDVSDDTWWSGDDRATPEAPAVSFSKSDGILTTLGNALRNGQSYYERIISGIQYNRPRILSLDPINRPPLPDDIVLVQTLRGFRHFEIIRYSVQ